ncbi:MAG: Uncharacterised protein [Flavobacteriaceae bacterium]|nr:MAG: Uncharacterised protein [Flavobacteriaceae bacterium]
MKQHILIYPKLLTTSTQLTTLYLANYSNTGITQVEYPYIEASNGDLTVTLFTGDFEVTYKLTR